MKSSLLLALAAGFLASCATTPAIQAGPHLTLVEGNQLPPPGNVDPATGVLPYWIGPFDTLQVNVLGVPEVSRSVQVDGGGRIAIPLAGSLVANGKTPQELSQEIAAQLRIAGMRDPRVTVNAEQTVSRVVTVDGEVGQPGLYPALGGMTLMRAIASAQGASEFARLTDVVVFRTVEGREMVALYNLDAIRRGAYPDPAIFANDVVIVGDSPARRLFRDILQASPLFVAPLVAVLQRP